MTIPPIEYREAEYTISTDKSRLDVEMIHRFLSAESYWAKNIPLEVVRKEIEHSLCYGVYHGERQVGFGRVVTDFATLAYLADIFILPSERGKGLGKWMVSCMLQHPELQGLRVWMLATRDAHDLYARYGFKPLSRPEGAMELRFPDRYAPTAASEKTE